MMFLGAVAKRTFTSLAVAASVAAAVWYAPPAAVAAALAVLAALAAAECAALLAKRLKPSSPAFVAGFAVAAAAVAAAMWTLWLAETDGGGRRLLYIIAIVKISDMGGFAFGLAFGRHKLCPSVSPNKTWEGLAGSVFASCLVSCLFMPMTGFPAGKSILLGAVAAILGTAGDLVESKFKRWAGVKDSSAFKFTNGMGGVLDMVDSLLLAPAAIHFLA